MRDERDRMKVVKGQKEAKKIVGNKNARLEVIR